MAHWRFFSVALRPYQAECIRVCLEKYSQGGIRRQAVSLPVGSGKTVIFSHLIGRLSSPNPAATKSLILAHREELLLQAFRQIEASNPALHIALEKGDLHADVDRADVVLASVPTIGRRQDSELSSRLKRFDPELFKCIIIDEAHHTAAPSYRRVLEHFRAFEPDSHLLVWGCSATLRRNDSLALADIFQEVTYHLDMADLMRDGWLCRAELLQVYSDLDLDGVKFDSGAADFSLDDLSLALNTPQRNALVAKAWNDFAIARHTRKSTIVFASSVAHAYGLAEAFAVHIPPTDLSVITGRTDPFERAAILDSFGKGHIRVLVNCSVLTEGTDLPITDCVLMARPTCNPSLYIQMVGRGLRKHPSKEYCLVLDVVDKLKSPRRSLVTFPNLYARTEAVKSEASVLKADAAKEPSKKKPRRVEEIHFGSVVVRISPAEAMSVNLEQSHRYAWISIPGYPIHVVDCESFRIVLSEDKEGKFDAIATAKKTEEDEDFNGFEWAPSHRLQKVIVQQAKLAKALEAVDAFIEDFAGGETNAAQSLLRSAYWRRLAPPSHKQIALLLRIARQCAANPLETRAVYSATKGKAAAAISRWNFLKSIKCPRPKLWHEIFH